jgi:AcrR family transcriptional regulator
MLVKMGRPREHDERTAAALLATAERAIHEHGLGALSVRSVAEQAGTTTRAVYSLFGSKDALVAALGAHAFEMLGETVKALPTTDDPVADLIAAGLAFRAFALEHPTLFAIAIQGAAPDAAPWLQVRAAATEALKGLEHRLDRLSQASGLGGRTVTDAAFQFHALCEGLAALELRSNRDPTQARRLWQEALNALVNGFGVAKPTSAGPHRPRQQRRSSARTKH